MTGLQKVIKNLTLVCINFFDSFYNSFCYLSQNISVPLIMKLIFKKIYIYIKFENGKIKN